jgi:NADH-quinone oxidoreductase subunit J
VLLLVAIIAAIALTLRERKDTKHTNSSDQVRIRARDRLQIIKQAPTMVAPQADPVPAAAEGKA